LLVVRGTVFFFSLIVIQHNIGWICHRGRDVLSRWEQIAALKEIFWGGTPLPK
jgi:hypothetical protein